jgi:hypothetical protein
MYTFGNHPHPEGDLRIVRETASVLPIPAFGADRRSGVESRQSRSTSSMTRRDTRDDVISFHENLERIDLDFSLLRACTCCYVLATFDE